MYCKITCASSTDHGHGISDEDLVPEGDDTQPDSPLEDTVTATLKRGNSIRRSQRNSRYRMTIYKWITKYMIG